MVIDFPGRVFLFPNVGEICVGRPSDEEIMIALCCGEACRRGEYCHRLDFASEAKRVRALLDDLDKNIRSIEAPPTSVE